MGKLGVEGSGGELGCGREGRVDAVNPILHHAFGPTIEIYKEICDLPKNLHGRSGQIRC